MPSGEIEPGLKEGVDRLVDWALTEDGGGVDVTSELVVPAAAHGTYHLVAREPGVFSGLAVLDEFARRFAGEGLAVSLCVSDGERIDRGRVLATLDGPTRLLLRIERPMLNFLQRLCGVATMARRFVDAVSGTGATVLDTRKTIPGWRELDKYAVRCGGGTNHRAGLHDAVLVKDNHLAAVPIEALCDVVTELVAKARTRQPPLDFVEIEVDSLDQLQAVLAVAGVDRVLLDNFALEDMQEAVRLRDRGPHPAIRLEASGGIDLDTARAVAETGVDFLSVGALTHSVRCLDLALDAAET